MAALVSLCATLVNPDNNLTTEGQGASDCIRNEIMLTAGGSFIANLQLLLVIALRALEETTDCADIVNWDSVVDQDSSCHAGAVSDDDFESNK